MKSPLRKVLIFLILYCDKSKFIRARAAHLSPIMTDLTPCHPQLNLPGYARLEALALPTRYARPGRRGLLRHSLAHPPTARPGLGRAHPPAASMPKLKLALVGCGRICEVMAHSRMRALLAANTVALARAAVALDPAVLPWTLWCCHVLRACPAACPAVAISTFHLGLEPGELVRLCVSTD